MPPGSLHCCKRLSRQNADCGRRGSARPRRGPGLLLAKNKHWENSPAQTPTKPAADGPGRTARSHDSLRRKGGPQSPGDTVEFPFHLRGCARTRWGHLCDATWVGQGRDVHAGGAEGGPSHSGSFPVEAPRTAPWRDAPGREGSRHGGAAPGPSCLPASWLRLGRTGSMSEARLNLTRPKSPCSSPSLLSGPQAAYAPNSGGAVCPVQVLRAEGRLVPGSARPPPLGPLHSPELGSRGSRLWSLLRTQIPGSLPPLGT